MGSADADKFAALSVEAAGVRPQDTGWERVRRNWSVRIGGGALLALLAIALAAPWLDTVDPTMFDAGSRDLSPGTPGEMMTLDGDTLKHTFYFGSDSLGRDVYSRVIFGTRVSLFVGVVT
jgi:peptide/nickel transport system permease protein